MPMQRHALLFLCKQEPFPSRLVSICAANTTLKVKHSSESRVHHEHICSHGNGDMFTVIKTVNCYENILVYLAMSHMRITCEGDDKVVSWARVVHVCGCMNIE